MSFQNRYRVPAPVRRRTAVFAIGRHVYVACPGDRSSSHIALTDDAGADARTRLADGTEVEILAWRPRGAGETRYHVRATRNGLEGWLAVDNLRSTEVAVPTPAEAPRATGPVPLPAPDAKDTKPRFGQRGG